MFEAALVAEWASINSTGAGANGSPEALSLQHGSSRVRQRSHRAFFRVIGEPARFLWLQQVVRQ
jgi:hypothetical protein